MELIVFIDFASAQARLALNPTRQLAEDAGIAVDWRPFSRKPRLRGGADRQSKGARHARIRAEYRHREENFYAEQQGLSLVYPDLEQEAFAANAGLAWLRARHGGTAASQCDSYVRSVFEQVWSGAMDPCDPVSVYQTIAAAGGETEGFDAWFPVQAEAHLDDHRRQALEWGAVDVPGYVVAGEPFVGRANLPIIRYLLTGQRHQGEI